MEFTDGTEENYFGNVIAENIFAQQVDSEGHQDQVLEDDTQARSTSTKDG